MSDESDSDSDSDASSDIGNLLQQSKAHVLERHAYDQPDSDDEDSSSDEGPVMYSGKKRDTVEARLANLQHHTKMLERQRKLARQRNNNSDDDSDEEVQVVGTTAATRPTNRDTRSIRVQVEVHTVDGEEENNKAVINLEGDDDSSDDEPAVSSTKLRPGLHSAARAPAPAANLQGASASALEQLEKNRKAREALQQAQSYHAQDVHVTEDSSSSLNVEAADNGQAGRSRQGPPRILQLTVKANIELLGQGSTVDTRNMVVSIGEQEHVSALQAKMRQNLNLPSDTVVTLQWSGVALLPARTLAQYNLEPGSTIDAMVLQTTLAKAKPSSATADLGKSITVVLRRALPGSSNKTEEQELLIRMKEPFGVLVDKYRETKKLAKKAKIVLKFDGETLNKDRTPQSYDMESDDLIDVVIQ